VSYVTLSDLPGWRGNCPKIGMGEAEDEATKVKRKLADMALKQLLYQMSGISQAWWFQGAEVGTNPDGTYYLLAKIHPKVPLDETGWPYMLPHDVNGLKVRSSRATSF